MKARGFQNLDVQFRRVEPDLDMGVVMEVEFRPPEGAARAWVWLTENDHLALGVDKVGELARLAGLSSQSLAFAAGHQPTLAITQPDDLLGELDDVSKGIHFLVGRSLFPRAKALALNPISGARYAWDDMGKVFFLPLSAKTIRRSAWT